MKLRTSYFNKTLFMKNLTRFAPAWVLYGLFLLLVVGSAVLSDNGYHLANNTADLIMASSAINICYAFLVGQLLFGDLFQSRMCNALHALPIRREGWFVTHLLSALAFSLIPNTVFALVLTVSLESYWLAGFLWLAATTLQFLFFFAVAALSAMLVGNRFAMLVVYGILNFFSCIVLWLVCELYMPHLYGVELEMEPFLMFCPCAYFFNFDWFDAGKQAPLILLADGWGYLGLCTVVAIGLLALALVLYRIRPLEKAADFMAFPKVGPAFLVMYTFCAGTALHLFCSAFLGEDNLLFLMIGLAIGFFTGRMLLDRTIKVFRWKTALKFAVLVIAFAASLVLTALDPLGITRWVPRAEQVQAVEFRASGTYGNNLFRYDFTESQDILDVVAIHRYAADHPEMANNGELDVEIVFQYTMKSGKVRKRTLYVDTATISGQSALRLLSRPEVVFGTEFTTADALAARLETAHLNTGDKGDTLIYDREQLRGLAEALLEDCRMGTMAQASSVRNAYQNWEWIYLEGKSMILESGIVTTPGWDIFITVDCVNTQTWLRENGYK